MSLQEWAYFVKVEDEIQLANVAEIFVKDLNKALHQLQHNKFVLILVYDCYEVETGEPLVNYFVFFVVQKIAHLGLPGND